MGTKIIVTEISEGVVFYPQLADWVRSLDMEPNHEDFDALSLMEGDPDIVRCDGDESYFITHTVDEVKYILVSDEVNDMMKLMLKSFHSDYFNYHFQSLDDTWDAFRSRDYSIAYRGGSGYSYSIWEFQPENVIR